MERSWPLGTVELPEIVYVPRASALPQVDNRIRRMFPGCHTAVGRVRRTARSFGPFASAVPWTLPPRSSAAGRGWRRLAGVLFQPHRSNACVAVSGRHDRGIRPVASDEGPGLRGRERAGTVSQRIPHSLPNGHRPWPAGASCPVTAGRSHHNAPWPRTEHL